MLLKPLPMMRILTSLPIALLALSAQASRSQAQVPNEYLALREAIETLEPDLSAVARVEGLTLERPAARLELTQGELALLRLGDRVVGAVFVGSGRFTFEATHPIERGQLLRIFEAAPLSEEIESAVLLFADDTEAELRDRLAFGPGAEPKDGRDAVRDAMRYLEAEDDDLGFDIGVMRTFLNGDDTRLFHVHIDPRRGDPIFYRFDATLAESVSLGRKARRGRVYDLVSSFPTDAQTQDPSWTGRDRLPAEVLHYEVHANIGDNMGFEAVARPFLVVTRTGQQWLPFRLFSELEVDSVRWAGVRTPHVRDKGASQLWVRTPGSVEAASTHQVEFFYHGDLIRRIEGWTVIRSHTGWYPIAGDVDATFDLHFTVPRKYAFAGTGKEIERREDGDRVYTHWSVERPSPHASFNLGEFTETTFERREPPVTLQVAERAHKRIEGLLLQQDIAQQVGSDIVNSLAFFAEAYGPTPVDQLLVTEIPYAHGQAFPEMLQLSWATFQWTGSKGHDEMFRAHEVAHLWWGLQARPRTYRDTWLSEGLAEFSGLWYMQRVLMNNELYFDRLNDAKKRILERRGKAGPIGLGPRVYSSRSTEDYQIVVYEKGAWVIQMLRNLMLDLDTMNEDVFKQVMQDLYALGGRGPIGTEDLKRIVEQNTGVDMTWFFDQWVYGSDVPTWRFSYFGREESDGYRIRARVVQEDVPDDFKMIVPVLVEFGDEGWARFRVLVEGPLTEFEFPLLPRKPDRVVFNDLESVLVDLKEETWRPTGAGR